MPRKGDVMIKLKKEMINSSTQIRKGAILSYIAIFFNIVAGLVYTPWMINQIGQSDYGLYSLAITLISFFAIDFGLGEAVARFLSKYKAEKNTAKEEAFLGIIFKMYIILDIIVILAIIILLLFLEIIYSGLTPLELEKFRVVFTIAGLYSIASFPFIPLNGILISNERFIFLKFIDLLNKFLVIITMVIVLILGYKLYALVIVNAVIGIVSIILKLNYLIANRLLNINFKTSDKILLKEILNFSIWTAILSIAGRLIYNITPTILAANAGTIQISIFAVAMTIEGYTWTFANALNGLFLPKITRMTTLKSNSSDIEKLMIKVGRIQLLIIGLLVFGIFFMGKEFMLLWMGSEFSDSYFVSILLIGPTLITLTQGIANTALIATNRIKFIALCSLISSLLSVCFSILLTQYFGAIGAGIAIAIGQLIGSVFGLNLVYHKILKINVLNFFKECHLKMSLPLLITGLLVVTIQKYFPVNNLFLFLIKAIVVTLIYITLMWKLALNNYEKNLIYDFLIEISRRRNKYSKS